jgi:hypothetical protein
MHTLAQLKTGQLASAHRLQLSCGLTEFPREIFDLADTLEILDLSGNALKALPADLARLTRLRIIFCSNNQFTVLPAVLGQCAQLTMIGFKSNRIREFPADALPPALRWLILTDNEISELPATIGHCTQLQKLMLAGNRLRDLPEELATCTQLALLRISANQMTALPDWLTGMPQLAWLAYAGNPIGTPASHPAAGQATIAWDRLHIGRQLGEGASGIIHQAVLDAEVDDTGPQNVAVKLFKGAITSDGLPDCELAACIRAGSHPNLIPVLGEVKGHPGGVHGCVMALVDPQYRNLAGPPSLDSCTRDVYLEAKSFTLEALLRLATGIASAALHLHSRGILHGDLYAHNILHTDAGDALLGDFGAASLFETTDPHTEALQKLEVRAFGLLLEELTTRYAHDARLALSNLAILASLTGLRDACIQSPPTARPLFGEVVRRLEQQLEALESVEKSYTPE